jgi:hypothetical protein
VDISGTGFRASKTITITLGDLAVDTTPSSITTDDYGSFSGSFIVPESYSGTHTVKVQDSAGNDATTSFSTTHSMSIDRTSGVSGDSVDISGTGFRASKTITITLGDLAVDTTPSSITTDDYGSFSGTLIVPVVVSDVYPVEVSDGSNQSITDFTLAAGAEINKMTGHVGTEITVSGTGFTADSTVSITYDDEEVASTTVNSNGTLEATFEIPPSKHGSHTIVASDSDNKKEFIFTMESEAPSIPKPLKPEESIKADAQAVFDWEDVEDPSSVTYTLQVSTDEDFTSSSIVLEKTGLTESEYTLTEEEELEAVKEEEPYYWRVKAIDGASNESGWASPGSFYVGFQWPELTGWILYVLIGVGAVLSLILGFWLGRRTAYY